MSDAKLPPIPSGVLTEDMPLRQLIREAYQNSAAHGFHEEPDYGLSPLERLGKYMLIATEVAEAAEVVRENGPEVAYQHHLPGQLPSSRNQFAIVATKELDNGMSLNSVSLGKPVGLLSEEADIVIRVFDEVGRRGQADQFVRVLIEKMMFNRTRPVMHGKNC